MSNYFNTFLSGEAALKVDDVYNKNYDEEEEACKKNYGCSWKRDGIFYILLYQMILRQKL
jgi:hypothetical protein